jgi:hypothetical protein
MRGYFGSLWEVDGSPAPQAVACADDLVIVPEHRSRGVATQIIRASLADAERRGFRFSVSLSAGPITFVTLLAAGWCAAGSYEPVQRAAPPRWHEAVQARRGWRVFSRARAALRRALGHTVFAHLDRAAARSPGPISVAAAPRPEAMAALVGGLPWDGRLRHVRDRRYFSWRFDNPLHEYRFLFWDDGALRGYLVLQRYRPRWADQEQVNIADWEATDERVQADLLTAALEWGRFRRIQTWSVGVPESTRTLLRDRGFSPLALSGAQARRQGLLVRRLRDESVEGAWTLGGRDLRRIANWDLRMLYSMAA